MLHNKAYSVPPRMHQMRNLTNAFVGNFLLPKAFIYLYNKVRFVFVSPDFLALFMDPFCSQVYLWTPYDLGSVRKI